MARVQLVCEQKYHGVVQCALGWACWKTYVGRSEENWAHGSAMHILGNGLSNERHLADALSVQEAKLSMMRRLGASKHNILITQGNLAGTCEMLGRHEEAIIMQRDVCAETSRLDGEESKSALAEALNYAIMLKRINRLEETKSLVRKIIPVARRVLGEGHRLTLTMQWIYAMALYQDDGATHDDLRESVETLESVAKSWKRVFGPSHPDTMKVQGALSEARDLLACARASRDGK